MSCNEVFSEEITRNSVEGMWSVSMLEQAKATPQPTATMTVAQTHLKPRPQHIN